LSNTIVFGGIVPVSAATKMPSNILEPELKVTRSAIDSNGRAQKSHSERENSHCNIRGEMMLALCEQVENEKCEHMWRRFCSFGEIEQNVSVTPSESRYFIDKHPHT
jgi:hypothetical protein